MSFFSFPFPSCPHCLVSSTSTATEWKVRAESRHTELSQPQIKAEIYRSPHHMTFHDVSQDLFFSAPFLKPPEAYAPLPTNPVGSAKLKTNSELLTKISRHLQDERFHVDLLQPHEKHLGLSSSFGTTTL